MNMERNPELTGLLAVQAFNFNVFNGGIIDDPVIYEALNKAFSTLDSSKHSIFTGLFSESRSLAENENELVGVDMDGTISSLRLDKKYNLYTSYSYFGGEFRGFGTQFDSTFRGFIDLISLSPGGNKMVINYKSNKLILKRITYEPYKFENSELQGHTGTVKAADWSNDGNYLVTGGRDSLIKIWNTGTKPVTDLKTIKAPSAIRDLVFCNTDTVISAHDDGSIILWVIHNSASELLYSPGTEKPLCIAWNGSKKTLMVGCTNGTLLLIDVTHVPYKFSRFAVHSSGIDQIVFSNDFTFMATASWDKLIRLYNYHEFFEMSNSVMGAINFDNLKARARSLFFTTDKKLVAGMSDKSIRIWETSSEKLVSLICGLLKRDMSVSEWTDNVGIEIPYEKTCKRTP
jgi:WD40 repeat protein